MVNLKSSQQNKKGQATMQNRINTWSSILVFFGLLLIVGYSNADGWLPGSNSVPGGDRSSAPNQIINTPSNDGLRAGGIANTRHNLTMSYNNNNGIMDAFRNNYYEICVYCHTPHGANSTANAPLWNRTVKQRNYILYNQDTSAGSTATAEDLNYTQPGPNSLTCLSCHDGATAIDSIINMPTQLNGSFRAGYSKAQETSVNPSFLDEWGGNKLGAGSPTTAVANAGQAPGHMGFNSNFVDSGSNSSSATQGECMVCHNPGQGGNGIGPDFQVFSIGDKYLSRNDTTVQRRGNYLADDHPIGVEYPKEFGSNVDYNEPTVKQGKIAFFDLNGNQHADPNEIRLYNSGDGYEVECASCHDPHGIKVSGDSNELIPSFLRVGEISKSTDPFLARESPVPGRDFVTANAGSSLCLTCHIK